MKNIIKNITLCGLVAVGTGMGLSSCEDFLTITPTDRIVEEEFWQDKRDLNNAVMACYWRLASSDVLSKFVYWGEERSDNVERSSSVSTTGPVANIMNANLLPTYDQFSWTVMYNVINYCNKVLAHGPEVVTNDESFSEGDWKPIHAEAVALRALCHFYLVRTFGEIPYVTEDYNNDSQELTIAQSTQLTVLNNIIADLESVMGEAMVDYGNTADNKGRITQKSIHALLADVYLWRASYKAGGNQPFTKITLASNYAGEQTEEALKSRHEDYGSSAEADYQKCIDYCDLVIARAKQERVEYLSKYGFSQGIANMNVELSDLLEGNESSGVVTGTAYNTVFGTGNSDESIFELQIDGTSSSNGMITNLFWNIKDNKAGSLSGAKSLFETVSPGQNYTSDLTAVFTKTDYRRWSTLMYDKAGNTTYDLIKYVARSISQVGGSTRYFQDNTLTTNSITQELRSYSNVNANWIVYRMSEIFLMRAEAMSQLYTDTDNLTAAFNYVREVNKRSNTWAYNKLSDGQDSLKVETFNTDAKNIEFLVMSERQREFIGEGKRWYDLVRYALRRGSTADMLKLLSRKYTSNQSAIQAKLADMQTLFSPVYNSEIKNNNLLYQNGVWSVNETSSRTDDL